MAGEERQDSGPIDEPVYESIGPGWNDGSRHRGDDAEWASQPGVLGEALTVAAGDWLRSLGTIRFWLVSAAVPLATSVAAWVLLAAVAVPPMEPAEGRFWAYLLASAFIPATSSFLAVHWGITGLRRSRGHRAGAFVETGPLAAFLAVAARGLVVAALALILLLVQAGLAGVSPAMAAAAAGVVALEFVVFGAVGTGASALVRRPLWAGIVGWGVAGALVAGNAVAVWALLPAIRAEEPVSVAFNVTWSAGGTRDAYECSQGPMGTAEVFHTERIVWLLAPNPVVMFVMFADDGGGNEGGAGWIPVALQEAADGTQVPCVNAEPRTKDAARMPLGMLGLGIQGVLAGAFLTGGQLAARRRVGAP